MESTKEIIQKLSAKELRKVARVLLSMHIEWKDLEYISDTDINEIKETDTRAYWEKVIEN